MSITLNVEVPISTHGNRQLAEGEIQKFIQIFEDRPESTAIPVFINLPDSSDGETGIMFLMQHAERVMGWINKIEALENGNLLAQVDFIEEHLDYVKQIMEDEEHQITIIPYITGNLVDDQIKDFLLFALQLRS